MSIVRVMTRPHVARRGMGAMPLVNFNDTGDGITPDNFKSMCCAPGLLWGFNFLSNVDTCNSFVNANGSLFAGNAPCSDAALANLTLKQAVPSMATPEPPVSSGNVITSWPYSAATPACTGLPVITADDVANFETCQAQRLSAAQAAAVMAQMTQNAADQCVAIKIDCANRAFAKFLKPSADCTDCVFDWTANGSLLLVGGAVLGGLLLVKLLLK